MKRAHSPAVPSLDLLEGLPAPQQPVVDSVPPCPLMLLRRSRISSQPISVGDNNNDTNNTNSSSRSSRKMGHGTPSTTTTTAAAAVAGLSRPSVLRTMSDSSIPRAPRMSSSEPNPLFLESLPQLSLPPPSVENGELLALDTERGNSGGGQKLSSSLRERMGSLAANFMHFTATSCPGSVGDATGVAEWQLDQEDETRSAATGHLLGGKEGETTKAKVVSSSVSLTALSLLVSKAFPTAGVGAAGAAAGGAGTKEDRGRHGVLTGVHVDGSSLSTSLPAMQLPPPALAVSTTPRTTTTTTRHGHAHAHGERKEGEAPFSFSAFTASTAATTASSVSSAGDGLEEDEDVASPVSSAASALSSSSSSQASEGEMEEGEEGEEAVGSPSADAAMGPFVLEDLSLEHQCG